MLSILRELFGIVKGVISKDDSSDLKVKEQNGRPTYGVMIQMYVIRDGERIRPRRDILAMALPYRHTIIQDAAAELGPNDVGAMTVKALCPEGLVVVDDDATWQRITKLAAETEWMDSEMKLIVELT